MVSSRVVIVAIAIEWVPLAIFARWILIAIVFAVVYDAETDGFHLLFDNDVDNGDMATDAAINLIAAYRVVSYSIIVVFDLPAPSDVTAEANGIVKLMISTMDNVAAASTEAAFDKRVDVVLTDADVAEANSNTKIGIMMSIDQSFWAVSSLLQTVGVTNDINAAAHPMPWVQTCFGNIAAAAADAFMLQSNHAAFWFCSSPTQTDVPLWRNDIGLDIEVSFSSQTIIVAPSLALHIFA